ncbi:hypothetical protein WME95_25445 [Sorangium sp. So ce327]|uniref:hypothetical protein n=1 Tax=Sorangium sp. So ce327 TaxID=3133301 RepID=UPI003F607DCB
MRIGPSALAAAAVAALTASCEGPLPVYSVPRTSVRLIPEISKIDEVGGPVFVLVELELPTDAKTHVIAYVRASGAEADALPGPVLCRTASDGSAGGGSGGADGGSDAGGGGADTGGGGAPPAEGSGGGGPGGMGGGAATPENADLTLPDVALLAPAEQRNLRQAGFLVNVPAGDRDVQLVATVYAHDEDTSECEPAKSQLLAMAAARIDRSGTPEDGGGSASGGGGAGAGGAGGSSAGAGGAGGSSAGAGGAGGSSAGAGGAGGGGGAEDGGGGG